MERSRVGAEPAGPSTPNSARTVKILSVLSTGNSTTSPLRGERATVAPPPACALSWALPFFSNASAFSRLAVCSAVFGPGAVVGAVGRSGAARRVVRGLRGCRRRDGESAGNRCGAGQRHDGAWGHRSSRMGGSGPVVGARNREPCPRRFRRGAERRKSSAPQVRTAVLVARAPPARGSQGAAYDRPMSEPTPSTPSAAPVTPEGNAPYGTGAQAAPSVVCGSPTCSR